MLRQTGLRGERVFNPPDYLGTEGSEIHANPRRLPLRQHFLRAELVAGSDRNFGPRLRLFVLHETWRRMDIAADRLSQDQHRRAGASLEIRLWNEDGPVRYLRPLRRRAGRNERN